MALGCVAWCASGGQNGAQVALQDTPRLPKGNERELKSALRQPKGSPRAPRGTPKGTKAGPRTAKWSPTAVIQGPRGRPMASQSELQGDVYTQNSRSTAPVADITLQYSYVRARGRCNKTQVLALWMACGSVSM